MNNATKSEAAIVRPIKVKENKFKQSKYPALVSTPCRMCYFGRSGSGKSLAMCSAMQDWYKGVFSRIYLFAKTAKQDPVWKAQTEWIRDHCEFEPDEEFVFTTLDHEVIERLMDECAERMNQERRAKKPVLSQTLFVFDDMTGDAGLKQRNDNPIDKLFFMGRHIGASVFLSLHSILAASTMQRKNATCMCCFRATAGTELTALEDSFAGLLGGGKEGIATFREIYDLAVNSEDYSFLTIKTTAKDLNETFMVRFTHKVILTSPEDGTGEPGGS